MSAALPYVNLSAVSGHFELTFYRIAFISSRQYATLSQSVSQRPFFCADALTLSHVALLSLDLLLCFDREVNCIWKRRFGFITVLYTTQRYATILEYAWGFFNPYSLMVRSWHCNIYVAFSLIIAHSCTCCFSPASTNLTCPILHMYIQLPGCRDHSVHSRSL